MGFKLASFKSQVGFENHNLQLETWNLPLERALALDYGDKVLHFEDHAFDAIVGGELDGFAHLAQTEGRDGCLLIFGVADWTFRQLDFHLR